MPKSTYWMCGGLLMAVVVSKLALAADLSREQPAIVITSFQVAPEGFYEAPHQTQPKSRLQGAKAQPQPDGRYLVTEAKWTFFRETGASWMVMGASQCFYDGKEQSVGSPGPLNLETADGNFALQGEGFMWRQVRPGAMGSSQLRPTNSVLIISNRVHTTIHPSLLQSSTNRSASGAPANLEVVEITSDRFQYDTGLELGVYEGNVRIAGTNLALTSGRLTVRLPVKEQRVHSVLAEQDVVVDYAQVHATGQRVDYSVDADLLQVSGQPTWRAEMWEGRADALSIDRTNQVFRATGATWLKLPGRGLGGGGLLSDLGPQRSAEGNRAASSNVWVEVRSESYERRPGWAEFSGGVNVTDREGDGVKGTLDCRTMSLVFGETNELQQMVAEKEVVIRQGNRGFESGKAVFTGTNGMLELTENPSWKDGLREGKGDLIQVQRDQMMVRGKASIRLPASEVAPSGLSSELPKPIAASSNQFAVIESEQYLLSPQAARFQGGVRITHPQMRWKSETAVVGFGATGGRAERLVAEPDVEFDLISDDGQSLRGTGKKAIYSYTATATKTNEAVRLEGSPAVLSTTNFTWRNDVIILDMGTYTVQTPGRYAIRGVVGSSETNKFQMPSDKWLK